MPCYARQHVDPGGRVCHQVQPCGGEVYGIVDGKGAVTFLVRVKEALEDPRRLLMDL